MSHPDGTFYADLVSHDLSEYIRNSADYLEKLENGEKKVGRCVWELNNQGNCDGYFGDLGSMLSETFLHCYADAGTCD